MEVYVCILDVQYAITGVGRTAEEAMEMACKEYRRTRNSGYGFYTGYGDRVYTNAQIKEYYGLHADGPIKVPGAWTE